MGYAAQICMFLKKNFPDEAVFHLFFFSESGAKNCHFVSLRLWSVKGRKGGWCSGVAGWRAAVFVSTKIGCGSAVPRSKASFWLGIALAFRYLCVRKEPFKRKETIMLAYTFVEQGRFELREKPRPELQDGRDAIVRVTLGSICTSDLHIKHGSVPRAVPGITVGHEMVGVVEEVGREVTSVKPGDRVTVNVETFCGECFFCRHGYVNNCTDPHGGWALGCRIDGGQAEFVRVPYADQGLNVIPPSVTDEQALFVGDILATGFWAARISEIKEEDTVLIIGAGPTGICTLQCVMLKNPHRVIVCERSEERLRFVREHYPGGGGDDSRKL